MFFSSNIERLFVSFNNSDLIWEVGFKKSLNPSKLNDDLDLDPCLNGSVCDFDTFSLLPKGSYPNVLSFLFLWEPFCEGLLYDLNDFSVRAGASPPPAYGAAPPASPPPAPPADPPSSGPPPASGSLPISPPPDSPLSSSDLILLNGLAGSIPSSSICLNL